MKNWVSAGVILSAVFISQAAIPSTVGWHQISGTDLKSVAPPNNFGGSGYSFSSYSGSVTVAWSGGAMDTKRNRLLIWGGGHGDYYGNEIYALDIAAEKMIRLTDPAVPTAPLGGTPALEELTPFNGTQPNGRHTYDGLCYMPNHDVMWAFGGSLSSGNGGNGSWTWIFNPATSTWKHVTPAGANPGANAYLGVVSAYDSATGSIFFHQRNGFYKYTYDANGGTYAALGGCYNTAQLTFSLSGVLDPKRRKFVVIGEGDQHMFDIAPGGCYSTLGSTGGAALIAGQGPGLAYDPVSDRIIGWGANDAVNNTVYSLNLDTKVWTPMTFTGGPRGIHQGTYGRFQYVPSMDLFVCYGFTTDNAYVLRLRPATAVQTPAAPKAERFSASPNPFRSSTVLQFSGVAPAKVSVADLHGRQVAVLSVHQGRSIFEGKDSEGRALAPGIYTAVFRDGNRVRSAKLVMAR